MEPVAGTPVTSEEREKAKTVTYGIVYGLSAWGLAKGPAGLGIDIGQAQNLISSFLDHFQGVMPLHPQLPAFNATFLHLCLNNSVIEEDAQHAIENQFDQ